MDEITESANKAGKNGFVNHVFNYDSDTKILLMNLVQYALLAVVPITLFNKGLNSVVPEFDESKGNVETLFEVVGEIVVTLISLLLIHRLVTFVPTYSGKAVESINLFGIAISFLILKNNTQGTLGMKLGLLFDRLGELWSGKAAKPEKKDGKKQNANIKVSQPISVPGHQQSRADVVMQQNPVQVMQPGVQGGQQNEMNQSADNSGQEGFGFMSPGYMPANEALGGGGFGSW